MDLQTVPDVPLLVTVPSTAKEAAPHLSAERRISPSWTVAQLKAKLEPVTGIPPGSQDLRIREADGSWTTIAGEERRVGEWSLRRGGEIEVHDLRPPSLRTTYFNDPATSAVDKYTMPTTQYEALTDSVLQWKKTHRLGRFDPKLQQQQQQQQQASLQQLAAERAARDEAAIRERRVEVGRRCRVGGEDARRGTVAFVGEVEGLGGDKERGARWVGVRFDEPVGRNDGSVVVADAGGESGSGSSRKRLFECRPGFGVLVRPEKVEVGEEWVPLDDLEVDEDMEEL